MKLNPTNKSECGIAVILFSDESPQLDVNPFYVPAKIINYDDVICDDTVDPDRGIIDYTGPIDLRHPASLIQMDSIFSARWNLWYEFAHHPNKMAGKSLVAIPVNPLLLASMKGGNSTCFNMDDVPRFPLYYLRYFKAKCDKSVLKKAKIGLETILSYTRNDGTMPYLISPWDGNHRPGSDLFDIYHSMRAVSEGIPVFSVDKAFTGKLISVYEKYRSFAFAHLSNGLFQDRASANGALLEAVYNRWKSTNDKRELDDIRKLADALCTDYARQQRSDFGEYIPWVLIGLTCAYKATGNAEYSTEAYEWLTSTVIPSLKLDRRYYYSVPNFKPSGTGEGLNANPLQIWYHTDALLQMYEIRHDERLLELAAWVFGDYYDRKRYASIPPTFIIDTQNPYTERWGSASAEDALRMMAKYLWQKKYPTLFEKSRANADTSSPCPWTEDPPSSANDIKSEIAFDDGKSNLSTVVGLYRNNYMSYHQVQDFTVLDTTRISNVKIVLHAHVGSKITPVFGFQESKIGIRMNGNAWRWLKLNLYMDDANHWLEIPIPVSELHNGLNRIETTSTVGSHGNMTPESLDMLGSSTCDIYQRSLHTHDFLTYQRLTDRNWGIRLRYDEIPYMETEIHSLEITPAHASVSIGDSLQMMVESSNANGKISHLSTITWSAKYGWIDKYGLYHPAMNGVDEITASVGRKTVKSMINVNASVPFGVEPPDSKERLNYSLPEGHISLTGTWDFMPDPKDVGINEKWYIGNNRKWGKIHVPGSWQAQGFGLDYHRVGWYRKQISVPSDWNGKQIWMKFDGVATSAKVWVNRDFVGEHTGNWSPFEIDITRCISTNHPNSIVVRVEELPNHFSAGFPLIVGMHFGGIWQPVSLYSTGNIYIKDVFIHPIFSKKMIDVEVSTSSISSTNGFIDYRITTPNKKTTFEGQTAIDPSGVTKVSIPISDPVAWSPESPALYHASIRVMDGVSMPAKKVLVIGAERHIVKLIEVNLDRQGYEIITANNRDEAFKKVEEENPDLIALDFMMQYIDGSEILQNLRHNPDTKDIPLIILNEKAQDANVFKGWQSGIELITDKPLNASRGKISDKRELSFGIRDVEAKDGKLLLNGKPIFIRGSLHWGFYPELISIVPNEKQIRKEFADLKKAGFNLVKVCMFTFPKRFYEIADEMGMLIWQEYPLWLTFPKSDDSGLHEDIIREYREWFKYDRNHPSVILRDLTCEAVDMNQELTRTIYDMGKSMTGNAVIEDNSAYLNTPISDFHDGHFYWEL
ncbi:MAG: sugar-binding domain-containing protein, partial [Armatimonadota bacterium]